MIKNVFYFFLLRSLHFRPDFLVMQKKGLIRNLCVFSKLMASQTGQQVITIDILPNISRSNGKQTMKFGQLVEYNTRNIFLEKLDTKCCEEASPRPFYKKSKLRIFLDEQSEMP